MSSLLQGENLLLLDYWPLVAWGNMMKLPLPPPGAQRLPCGSCWREGEEGDGRGVWGCERVTSHSEYKF